jgi:hypothetical protein
MMIEAIIQEIKNLPADYKAEALAGQLLGHHIVQRHLYVRFANASRRPYSRDVYNAEKINLPNGDEALQLTVSRTSLYELLPEGIFFQPPSRQQKKKTAADMAEEARLNKKTEQKIRNFFSPLEQEFFYHRFKSYQAETDLLDRFEKGLLDEYLVNFWQLDRSIPRKKAIRMVLLMPFIHQVTGNIALMGDALAAILQEKVSCCLEREWHHTTAAANNRLGQIILGNSSTCGADFEEESFVFNFCIELSGNERIGEFLEGGRLYSLLQTFYHYFVPANAGYKTTVIIKTDKKDWELGDKARHHLGISSTI